MSGIDENAEAPTTSDAIQAIIDVDPHATFALVDGENAVVVDERGEQDRADNEGWPRS